MKLSYFYLILSLTVVDIILLAFSIRRRDKKAVKSFCGVITLLIIAHVFYGASLIIQQPEVKFFVHELKFAGVAFFSVFFYSMYMDLFDMHKMLTRKRKTLLSIIPAITVILAVTNNYHHLFRKRLYVVENDYGSFIGVESGPLFFAYILYTYSLFIFVIGVIIKAYFKTPKIYRMQIGIMVSAAVVTLIVNFISISNLLFEDFGDATLISFTIAAVIQFYGLVLYKPIGMIRMTRDMAVNEIRDPLITFDYENLFLDANTAARSIFIFAEGESLPDFLERNDLPDTEKSFKRGSTWYTIKQKTIYDSEGRSIVSTLLLRDITEMIRREHELENLASHDYLTGIANRHAYQQELRKITEKDLPVAIIRFNIGGMNSINNRFGNEAGDGIIKQVAAVISTISDKGFCARIGGDEFTLLLRNTTEADAHAVIKEIDENLPGITLASGLAVKQSNMDNINIINKLSMDNMHMNKLLANSGRLRRGE